MPNRFQKGSLRKVDGIWVAQWWDGKSRKKRHLGKVTEVTQTEAMKKLSALLAPVNARTGDCSGTVKLRDFVMNTYLPLYRRKWKRSTFITNEERVERYILPALGDMTLESLRRERLQDLLDQMAAQDHAFNTISHVRWDLRQMLQLAVNEAYIDRNPAELLFVPRGAAHPDTPVMNEEEIRRCIEFLEERERVIVMLAILTGLRPGEIFALRCGRVHKEKVEIRERLYRKDLDTPKTRQSVRDVALPSQLSQELQSWIAKLSDNSPEDWVFPSENPENPVTRDNVWRRNIQPRLKKLGLGWVNFQVFRRTHATLMRAQDVDPKLVADNMGHSVDVNQNVYTKTALSARLQAVEKLADRVRLN